MNEWDWTEVTLETIPLPAAFLIEVDKGGIDALANSAQEMVKRRLEKLATKLGYIQGLAVAVVETEMSPIYDPQPVGLTGITKWWLNPAAAQGYNLTVTARVHPALAVKLYML